VIHGTRDGFLPYNGSTDPYSIAVMSVDFFHVSLEDNWNLTGMKAITIRRFAFFIVANDRQMWRFKNFALSLWERWCFSALNFSIFRRGYPSIEINESGLPAIAVMNREKTKFKIMENLTFDNELKARFANMSTEADDPEMVIEYIDPNTFPDPPTETQAEPEDRASASSDFVEIIESVKEPEKVETRMFGLSFWVFVALIVVLIAFVGFRRFPRACLSRNKGSAQVK
jgi:hypothetical protein